MIKGKVIFSYRRPCGCAYEIEKPLLSDLTGLIDEHYCRPVAYLVQVDDYVGDATVVELEKLNEWLRFLPLTLEKR
jgi:hypothetical protein